MTVRSINSQNLPPSGMSDAADFVAGGLAKPDHTHQYHQDPVPLVVAGGFVANTSYDGPDVFKVGNFVQCRGVLSGPALAAGVTFLQIPVTHLPMRMPMKFGINLKYTGGSTYGPAMDLIQISPGGLISFVNGTFGDTVAWMSIYSMRWLFK
jgi:hypothetical protein